MVALAEKLALPGPFHRLSEFSFKGVKKRVFEHFNEVEAELELEKVAFPPIFGVGEYEKGTLRARRWPFGIEKALFWAKGGRK